MSLSTPDLAALQPAATWAWLVSQLTAAAGSARHGFHLLTVATVGTDGRPDARTVVLRNVDSAGRVIRFHSDIRSPKVRAIHHDPRVALHWYDPTIRVQARIDARATIHHGDDLAAAAWDAAAPMSRACYTTSVAPGSPLDTFPVGPASPAAGDDAGRGHFAVISCRFDSVELLALHAAGHQRVRLHLDRDPVGMTILARKKRKR